MFFLWLGITSHERRDRPSCHGRPCSRISVSCSATADIRFLEAIEFYSYPLKTNIDRNSLRPIFFCGKRGIRTPGTVIPYDSLANCWFKPLTHLSVLDLKSRAKISSFLQSANFFALYFSLLAKQAPFLYLHNRILLPRKTEKKHT